MPFLDPRRIEGSLINNFEIKSLRSGLIFTKGGKDILSFNMLLYICSMFLL